MMMTSRKGLELIKRHEGLRLRAYKCPADVWTIGYGSTGPHVSPGMVITETQADILLRKDVARFEEGVSRLVKVKLTQGQFDALVSFSFNVGLGALGKSTLLRKLNAGRYADVPAELMKWTKAGGRELPGLVKRRRDEAGLWRSIGEADTAGRADGVVQEPKPPKTMAQSKTGGAAVIAAVTGAAAPVNEAIKAAKDTADGVTGLMAAGPWVLLAIVIVGVAAFIWYDRRKKLIEEHV